ncbi:TPA: hypothetical protein RCG95_000051 [Enterobacter roggenkampii]|nr:hypothetical protein [Enterobacter roggenkampii]
MAHLRIKDNVNLYVTDYLNNGQFGKVKGPERLVVEVSGKIEVDSGFLLYRPFGHNGIETYAGINLSDLHSFRIETIKDE